MSELGAHGDQTTEQKHDSSPPGEVAWANLPTLHGKDGWAWLLKAELARIMARREAVTRRLSTPENSSRDATEPRQPETEQEVHDSLSGLALSGGGIRSGAFGLGVLVTLKKTGVLDAVDYLSTVSGGGYAGAYWSSQTLTSADSQSPADIGVDKDGRVSERLMRFIRSGNYLARTASFFNRSIPGLVLILTLVGSGLIAGASGLAYLFREVDQPEYADAIAAIGFDGDVLRALFPAVCLFCLWSLAWVASYWKYVASSQAKLAGILFWPWMISVLAAIGILLATGDIGVPAIEQLMGAAPDKRSVPDSFRYMLYSVIGASLLPYLKLPLLVRSGLQPRDWKDKYIFAIASAALLVGVPFVAFTWMARENISGYLEKRGPELAEADLFGGLQPDQRQIVFDVMEKMATHDESVGNGNDKLRGELEKKHFDPSKIQGVLALNRQYVNDKDLELRHVFEELRKLDLNEPQSEFAKKQLVLCWTKTRDWTTVDERLRALATQISKDTPEKAVQYQKIARAFLEGENLDRGWLWDELTKAGLSQEKSDEFVTSVRTLWPPREAPTGRRIVLEEEIRPMIGQLNSEKQELISDFVWKFAVLEDYVRHKLSVDLTEESVSDGDQRELIRIARNYWPPRHHEVIEEWNRLFAQQAVHELPHAGDSISVQSYPGAAVAQEKMSIPQRLRYLASLAFHWGVKPLVDAEGSGIERNRLRVIWKIRQARRDVEAELVKRLSGQILANEEFVTVLHRIIAADKGHTSRDSSAKPTQSERDQRIQRLPASEKLDELDSLIRHSARDARLASENWIEWVTRLERKTETSTEALKDEENLTEELTSQKAVEAVRREELRYKLVLANRTLLENYIAYKTSPAAVGQSGKAVGTSPTNSGVPRNPTVSLHSEARIFGRTVLQPDQEFRAWVFWRAVSVFLVALVLVDLNSTSLHGFYRTRIAQNWIEPVPGVGREIALAQADTTSRGAPYHLISGSLNLLGRRHKDAGDTRADHFLFSPLFCGSDRTGYVATGQFAGGEYKLADAISVSGAAVSPAQNTGMLIRVLLFLGNLRLGQWLPNPAFRSWMPRWFQQLRFWYYVTPGRFLWQSWQLAERRPFVFVTDGGHHENLGIGPLLARRCRVILAFDAGADETFQFLDLANLVRWAELEQGVRIKPLGREQVQALVPTYPLDRAVPEVSPAVTTPAAAKPDSAASRAGDKPRVAANHWVAARIEYPEGRSGLLIYLKANLTGDEPFDVLRFARAHDQFPHDTTVDQLYDPEQFASYLQLGTHIAQELANVLRGRPGDPFFDRLWTTAEFSNEEIQSMRELLKNLVDTYLLR